MNPVTLPDSDTYTWQLCKVVTVWTAIVAYWWEEGTGGGRDTVNLTVRWTMVFA